MQAQERAAQATAQADAMQQQYEATWSSAEDSHRTGKRLLDALTKVSSSCSSQQCRAPATGALPLLPSRFISAFFGLLPWPLCILHAAQVLQALTQLCL